MSILLFSHSDIISQVDTKLLPAVVSLRQEVTITTVKSPEFDKNSKLAGGTVISRENDVWDIGSGTVISKTGLILTNYHVWNFENIVKVDSENNVAYKIVPASEDMLVYMLDAGNVFKEPKKKYVAHLMACDKSKDVAILKCVLDANTGTEIHRNDFPYISLGSPFSIPMNSRINIAGYPGIGGKTVSITEGKFLGYVSDDDCTIKTDAVVSFGNSGGAALYQNKLFGVPTYVSTQTGGAFGYIVPVTRALGPLAATKIKYREDIPAISRAWIQSELNSDASRNNIFVGLKILSAQANIAVEGARVVIYRQDRDFDQIDALYREINKLSAIYLIQTLYQKGMSIAKIAQSLELDPGDVEKAIKVDIADLMSTDAKKYFEGEFFFVYGDTDADGFYITNTPIPRNQNLTMVVIRDGYRRLEKTVKTADDIYQDLGTVKLYAY